MCRYLIKKGCVISLFMFVPLMILGQQYNVKGRVVEAANSQPLVGANVYIKGTSKGAISDQNGDFELKGVKRGSYLLVTSYVGFYPRQIEVDVIRNIDIGEVELQIDLLGQEIIIQGSRAIEGKSAVTFNTLSEENIKENYTGQDVPGLLERIPGVFGSTSGFGESEVSIRGFDAERIQILINGVPVNDPESHTVYWSNWTGLSSAASSIQVQRGVGSSLVAPGALGGSINVETGNFTPEPSLKVIASTGVFHTTGIDTRRGRFGRNPDGSYTEREVPSGQKDETRLLVDGTGGKRIYNPSNQLFSIVLSSGYLCWGSTKWNYYLSYERKAGDSYGYNTYYNGHSFYAGLQMLSGRHAFTINLHGAPQEHNQQRTTTDRDLIRRFGREYNRNSSPYQQNYYFKPVLEFHWDYVSNNVSLQTVLFATRGTGGGRYLRNDLFNTVTGENTFKPVSVETDWLEFGRHAKWIYEKTGEQLAGYNPDTEVFSYRSITRAVTQSGSPLTASQFGHSWQNDSQNNHEQFGGNTTLRINVRPLELTFGGEYRYWDAQHFAESKNFRYYTPNGPRFYDQVMNRYNYDGFVTNISGFGRFLVDLDFIVLNGDLQYAYIKQRVEERPVEIFDFSTGQFIGESFFATKGSTKFNDDDYERNYEFLTPKGGLLIRLHKNINLYGSYSLAYKEPKVGDWYDRTDGPGANQISTNNQGEEVQIDLEPEKVTNIEAGLNVRTRNFEFSLAGYHIDYTDRIESITDQSFERLTINVGNATHKGIEASLAFRLGSFNMWASGSISENRWADSLNAQEIFGISSSEVEGRYVTIFPTTHA